VLLLAFHPLRASFACPFDHVEHQQGRASNHGILEFAFIQILDEVDADFVRRISGIDSGTHGGEGYQVDEPSEAEQSDDGNDGACEQRQHLGDESRIFLQLRELMGNFRNNIARYDGRHGHRTNADILRHPEHPVAQGSEERRVQAVLHRQLRVQSVEELSHG
jgi:hypothetical protein